MNSQSPKDLGSLVMKSAAIVGVASALFGALPAAAGTYDLTVDRVEINTGDFVKTGIGFNGASPGPTLIVPPPQWNSIPRPSASRNADRMAERITSSFSPYSTVYGSP